MIRIVITVSIIALFLIVFQTPITDFLSMYDNTIAYTVIGLGTQFIQPIISQLDLLTSSFPLVLNFIFLIATFGLVRLAVISFAK